MPSIFTICSKMSQSNAHRELVLATARAIQQRHRNIRVLADLQETPGDPVPPLIGGYRPDIVARNPLTGPELLIAEAKTDHDISNQHTLDQIDAFLGHLDALPLGVGTFILAVDGRIADHARTVLRFACRQHVSSRLRVNLFDGLDFWNLGALGAQQWRLS